MPSAPNYRRLAAMCVLRSLSGKPPGGRIAHIAPAIISLAETQKPRQGRWYEDGCHVEITPDGKRTYVVDNLLKQRGDGRNLGQRETDALIQVELLRHMACWGVDTTGVGSRLTLRGIVDWPSVPRDWSPPVDMFMAVSQRGGIHSAARVRALAIACWGDRDVGRPRPL